MKTKMETTMDNESYIDYLLSPIQKLPEEVFDEYDILHEDLRQKLLRFCYIYEEYLLNIFPGLEISDMLLVGSTTTFFHNKNSDLDVVIKIKNNNCTYLSKDPEKLLHCIVKFSKNIFFKYIPPKIGNKFVDIKLETRSLHYFGAYSIKDNLWLRHPKNNFYHSFRKNDIVDFAYEETNNFHKFIAQMKDAKTLSRVEKAKKIIDYHHYILQFWNEAPFYVYQAWKFLKFTGKLLVFKNELFSMHAQLFSLTQSDTDEKMDNIQLKNLLTSLTKRQNVLCPDLFDTQQNLLPGAYNLLNNIADFISKEIQKMFIGIHLKDVLLCGGIAGYLYNENTEIDLILLWEIDKEILSATELEEKLKMINHSWQNRGYFMNIAGRNIRYVNYAVLPGGSGIYSVRFQQWLKKPVLRDFSFTFSELWQNFIGYIDYVNVFMQNLPKDSMMYLSVENAEKAEYLYYSLKNDALQAERESIAEEYDLNYILYRAFVKSGEAQQLLKYITDSYVHNLTKVS